MAYFKEKRQALTKYNIYDKNGAPVRWCWIFHNLPIRKGNPMQRDLSQVFMACRGVSEAGGRCRAQVSGPGMCRTHEGQAAITPPHKVLLTFGLSNFRKVTEFEAAGVYTTDGKRPKDRFQAQMRHAQQAQAAGRPAGAYGEGRKDSGTLVFPENVNASVLRIDPLYQYGLDAAGYRLTRAHVEPYRDSRNRVTRGKLLLTYIREDQVGLLDPEPFTIPDRGRGLIESFIKYPFKRVYVYANLPDQDGVRMDTVNCTGRLPEGIPADLPQEPAYLNFCDGFWEIDWSPEGVQF